MNTPAHAIVNLWALGRKDRPSLAVPLLVGACLPDLPILIFYIWEKVQGTPERLIWSTHYFQPGWQLAIDVLNALPLLVVAALVAHRAKMPRLTALFASMGLHALGDLPVHHDDAHRHFLPFSHWRFESPISYWDPAHGGQWFTLFEIVLVLAGSLVLWHRFPSRGIRTLVAVIGVIYLIYFGFVAIFWL